METKYCGHKIVYREDENKFECEVEGQGTLSHETLAGVKAKIDKLGAPTTQKQPSQKGIEVREVDGVYQILPLTVGTFGIVEHRSYQEKYVWVTKIGYRGREERQRDRIYGYSYDHGYIKDTPANRVVLQLVADEQNRIKKEQRESKEKVEKFYKKLSKQKIVSTLKEEDLPRWDK